MTNLKKTLAVVLAFAMVLSMGAISTFAAYSDVEAGTVVSEAVDILSGLNVITGFEDGTFKPEETVTRAQMAAIICRTLGYEDQAQSSMGTTVFNDVAADHWASGYINVAQAQQIINGYGNGNYGPEDQVTYEQAVKMIVAALGYDLAAQSKGGYPTGYLAIASAEGITKSANGKVGDAAKRGTIAVLVYNSLEVRLMDQTSWSTGSDGDRYGKQDKTILSNYLDVVKVEGVVKDTPLTDYAKNGYDANKDAKIGFDAAVSYAWEFKYASGSYSYEKVALGASTTLDGTSFFADKVDTSDLLGKYVVAYIGEDEKTGNDTVFAIAESKSKNESIAISGQQLVENGQKYWNEPMTIGYTASGSSKIQDLTLDNNYKVYVNYGVDNTANLTTQLLAGKLARGGIVEFVSNDADSEIEYVLVKSYDREAVIEKANENNGVYTFDCYKGKLPKVDPENEDKLVAVYKDGVAATAADLAENDTVSYIKVADGFEILYASSATVNGVVDSYDPVEQTVTIGGTDYEISKSSGLSAEKLSGEEGIFFLNVDGQIAHNETEATSVGKYAFVVAAYKETTGLNSGEYLQVALADGTVAEYQIADTAKVVDADNTVLQSGEANFKAFFTGKMTQQTPNTTYKATVANAKANAELMVKLTVSNDKITKAKLIDRSTPTTGSTSSKYDVESNSLGALNFDGSTVVFSVKQTTGVIDADDIKVGAVADFFADDEDGYDIVAYDEDTNSSVLGAVVGFGISKAISSEGAVFVVSSKKTTTYDDNDAYVLTGMMAGEEKTITVYNKDGYNGQNPEDLVAGDVILISEPNAEGIVSDIEQLVDFTKGANVTAAPTINTNYTSGVDTLDQIHSGAGLVTSATTNKFAISAAVKDDAVTTTASGTTHADKIAANTGISYRSAANYTLVDFSENFKTPSVTYEDGSDYLFDSDYMTYAYVRFVDGKLADAVVYRFAEYAATDIKLAATATAGAVLSAEIESATTGVTVTYTGANVTAENKITASCDVTVTVTKTGYAPFSKTFAVTVG